MRLLISALLLVLSTAAILSCRDDKMPDQPEGDVSVVIDGEQVVFSEKNATMVVSQASDTKTFTLNATEGNRSLQLIIFEANADTGGACLPNGTYELTNTNRTATLTYLVDGQIIGVIRSCNVNVTDCNVELNRLDADFTAELTNLNSTIPFTSGKLFQVFFDVQ